MSRRKQTNPFKVNWPFHTSGITGLEHTINMDGRDEFSEGSAYHQSNSQEFDDQDSISEDSDSDLDNNGDDSSSNTSADDHMTAKRQPCRLHGAGVKEESEEGGDRSHSFVCPLCTLDFSSPEKLISHVYQHTAMMSSSKSYVCPVCGRALSSPGSLGRHLLIHSEDRLSNCAVCGMHFTDTNNFNRDKLKEVLNPCSMDCSSGRDTFSNSSMTNPGPGHRSLQGPGPSANPNPCQSSRSGQGAAPNPCQGPRQCHGQGPNPCQAPHSCQGPGPSPSSNSCQGPRTCQGPGPVSSQCHGPRSCHGQNPGAGPCSGPGQCSSDQGQSFPSLPDSLLTGGSSLPSIPDSLSSSSAGLPSLPDLLSPMPVYPAGVLLVCNSCVAYQQLMDSQSPMRKWALRRKNEPIEARIQRLERERTAKKSKRAHESEEEREIRRLRDREAKRMQRLQESEEQRSRRLQRDREAMRMKRANETPEKRQARLIREREAKRIKRRLEKIDPSLRTQIEHDPAAMAALTADMSLFQFPCPMPVPSIDNGLFMKLP